MDSNLIIERLGGTKKTAEFFGITEGAVSQWRKSKNGMPDYHIKYLRLARPDIFEDMPSESA